MIASVFSQKGIKVAACLVGALVVLIGSPIAYFSVVIGRQNSYIRERCPNAVLHEGFAEFVDCQGVIGIERYLDEKHLSIFDYSVPGSADFLLEVSNYKRVNGAIYFIEDVDLNSGQYVHFKDDDSYITSLKVEGNDKTFKFVSEENIPLLRKIDMATGNFSLFKNLDEVPIGEQQIFRELSIKPQMDAAQLSLKSIAEAYFKLLALIF